MAEWFTNEASPKKVFCPDPYIEAEGTFQEPDYGLKDELPTGGSQDNTICASLYCLLLILRDFR